MHPGLSAFLSRRLIDRAHGHRRRVLQTADELRALDRRSRAEIEDYQRAALSRLLRHAAARVPRYRELMGRDAAVSEDQAWSALAALPPLNRSEIQADLSRCLAEPPGDLFDDATGGSTGTPMTFKVDRPTQIAREASLQWADGLTGWRYGERIAMLWGSDRDVRGATAAFRSALRWRVENRRWYNAFAMGEAELARFHRELESFQPHLLVAYAGSIFLLARFLKERGLVPSYPRRGIVSSAEMILPGMRKQVEEVFGRPVFDRYGNREAGAIAAECPVHQGLHVNEAQLVVEIESPDPVHTPGPILITYLGNYAMPFIRYRTGDLGCFLPDQPCACGRRTRRLAPVVGRQGDTIRTASGRLIHGEYFTHLLYGQRAVKQFQFVQESLIDYRLRVVCAPEDYESNRAAWKKDILDAVGVGATVEVQRVEEIPPLPSGKHKFTISKLTS